MRRAQLFEFHDLPWFPASARDTLTDFMSWFVATFRVFRPVVPLLAEALERSGATRIVDLCSGGGAPPVAMWHAMSERFGDRKFLLTDKYPNLDSLRRAETLSAGAVSFVNEPVDAANVPAAHYGFRTLYASFHHFRPEVARAILRDAVEKGEGIGIFEYTERNFWVWGPALVLTPLFMMLTMPFVRPFRCSHLLWTWFVPFFTLVAVWDGVVSCLRTYTRDELLALTPDRDCRNYEWRTGRVRAFGGCFVTYLIGCPSPRERNPLAQAGATASQPASLLPRRMSGGLTCFCLSKAAR